eukprot:7252261-Karenia_brevis.AAC.1
MRLWQTLECVGVAWQLWQRPTAQCSPKVLVMYGRCSKQPTEEEKTIKSTGDAWLANGCWGA